jgi:CRISPR/Cas system endoribonuclease Cas6 (RAMP superfamily)
MTRDENLIAIRPEITTENITNEPMEVFQNKTLRQVLKLQNDTLLAICLDFLNNKYKNFEGRDNAIKKSLMQDALKTDQALKKLLYGVVVGQFTSIELAFYLNHKADINKRLVEFIYKRVLGQLIV